ncbi:hypothetical protein ACA910_014858 [Epithemia clementina (nom. ined.)]
MLIRTLRPGRHTSQVQYETARKVRSTVSNFMHTSPWGVGPSTASSGERSSLFFTGSPTNSYWFRRFMTGCQRCMGNVWIPDCAVTVEVVLGSLEILEEDFGQATIGQRKLEVCLTAAMLVVGYTAVLRGEEIPQVDIGMMRKYWNEGKEYTQKPHVPLTLVGRFIQTNGATKTFIQPLAPCTSSGIRVQQWLGRTIEEYHKVGVVSGLMFRTIHNNNKIAQATVGHLDALFIDILKRLQHRRPDLIPSEFKVEDEYSVRRSLRRGATAEAQNRKIPAEKIEVNNRWRKHIRARSVLPSMSMLERYSDAKASVEAIIEFSVRM